MLDLDRYVNLPAFRKAAGAPTETGQGYERYGAVVMATHDDRPSPAIRTALLDAAGNPVDITGGEPPKTYQNTIKLGLEDPRIHALILGYWHTIVTPPMVFARNMVEVKKEMEAKGFIKPMVASLAGDVEVEEAAEYLYQNGIPAYAYSTELPVEVLGAKYKWARGAGLL